MVEMNEIVRKVVGELHSGSNPETADINIKDNVLRVAMMRLSLLLKKPMPLVPMLAGPLP